MRLQATFYPPTDGCDCIRVATAVIESCSSKHVVVAGMSMRVATFRGSQTMQVLLNSQHCCQRAFINSLLRLNDEFIAPKQANGLPTSHTCGIRGKEVNVRLSQMITKKGILVYPQNCLIRELEMGVVTMRSTSLPGITPPKVRTTMIRN